MRAHVKRDGNLERVTVGERRYVRLPRNTRKFTQWNGLRTWKRRKRHIHNFNNTYEGETLIGQILEGRARPIVLPEFSALKPIRCAILGWVTLACKVRGAYALRMNRGEWGFVCHCHPNTWDAHREYLVSEGWLKLLRDYRPGAFKGRDGTYRHRQMANWYAPGWRLERAWERFERHRKSEKVEPISDPTPPSVTSADQNCDPFVPHCEKQGLTRVPRAKESPLGTGIVEMPTPSASGADGPVKESAAPTEIDRRPAGAADQEGIASAAPRGPASNSWRSDIAIESRIANSRDSIVALIGQLGLSRFEQRDLIQQYDRSPAAVEASIRAWYAGGRR